jgi:hypothetical protein
MLQHGLPVAAFCFGIDRAKCRALFLNVEGLGRRRVERCSGQQQTGNDGMKSPCRNHQIISRHMRLFQRALADL